MDSPEANLIAPDDQLLARERETFRLWESPTPFIVVGKSARIDDEVHLPVDVPIVRRSSGGGTVLQGPGCLNFTFVRSLVRRPELVSVEASYPLILKRVAEVLKLADLKVHGSDILFNGRKVSGSAQRRTRHWLLHHGTLLYDAFDLNAVEKLLKEPQRQPAHRQGRTHAEFLTRLPLSRTELMQRLSVLAKDSAQN